MRATLVYNPLMTTATDIDTIQDLVRILDDNPEWLEAMRARLLTRELLEMPSALAKFAEETNRRFDEVNLRFDEQNAKIDALAEDSNRRFDKHGGAIQRLYDQGGVLKAAHARNVAARDYGWMTRNMGLMPVRMLPVDEMDELALRLRDDGGSQGDVHSFRKADMLIEATDADGETLYIAAEISYTVDERDTSRAMRNAGYITKLTGKPARAAVVGASFDYRVRALIEDGEVYWHPFSEKDLQVD